MRYKLEILPTAWDDLKSIQDYYCLAFSKESALKVSNSILDSIEKLQDFPSMGSILNQTRFGNLFIFKCVLI